MDFLFGYLDPLYKALQFLDNPPDLNVVEADFPEELLDLFVIAFDLNNVLVVQTTSVLSKRLILIIQLPDLVNQITSTPELHDLDEIEILIFELPDDLFYRDLSLFDLFSYTNDLLDGNGGLEDMDRWL